MSEMLSADQRVKCRVTICKGACSDEHCSIAAAHAHLAHAGAPHRCRSYAFVAATMPRAGGKSVAGDLRKQFPDMVWLEGRQLHQSKLRVRHHWRQLASSADVAPAVIDALHAQGGSASRTGQAEQALVFCSDAAAADALHAALLRVCCCHTAFWHEH